jgi:predicted nuclease of predicted toxin-antitoxin system
VRFKVDENLHEEVADLLRQHGHDAVTVHDQQMQGQDDDHVATVYRREIRVIVTQDLHFSNILAYPPEVYAGIIVLRLHDQSRPSVVAVVSRLITLFATESLVGCLWIVDDIGMRIRQGGTP